MNTWKERFTEKLEAVREAARGAFERAARDVVVPVYDEFRAFAVEQNLQVTAPLDNPGLRTFKFAVTENAYVFLTFRSAGMDGCELQSEFFVPGGGAIAPVVTRAAAADVTESWVRGAFEKSLDTFMDAYIASLTNPSGGSSRPARPARGARKVAQFEDMASRS